MNTYSHFIPDHELKDLQRKAPELVNEHYSIAAGVAALDLEALNSVRPPSVHYHSHAEVLREFLSRAGAVATFALNLGLITASQAAEAIRIFQAAHPKLTSHLED